MKFMIFCHDRQTRMYIALDYIKKLYKSNIGITTNLPDLETIDSRFNINVSEEINENNPNIIGNKIVTPNFLNKCLSLKNDIIILPINYPLNYKGFTLLNVNNIEETLCIHTIEELELQ